MSPDLKEKEKTTAPKRDWLQTANRIAAIVGKEAAQHDADDSFVTNGFQLLKDEGFFKAMVPAEFGGEGASVADMCAVIRRLGASCGSTALACSMHTHLVAVAAWRWRHQKAPTDGLLRRIAAEDLILVSSGGSDWLKSAGVAVKAEGGFTINACKIFSSGCPMGDLLLTSAVYADPASGPTVLHFAVPLKANGVRVLATWRAMGMRGTGSHDIELKDVFIPDAAVSGRRPQDKWHPLFHIISMMAFSLIYAAYLGVAEGARAKALELARKKTADANLPYLVGEMENAIAGAAMAHADLIQTAETGEPGPAATSRAMVGRTLVAQGAIRTVERAMEIAGGASFYRETGLEQALRDVQGARFHPLQEKPQLRFTGRHALGWDIDG